MNLLEKIEAALDSATPPMSDLLRECEAYVRAGMDQPPVIYIAEDDAGGFMASRTPDEDEPWEPLYRHPMPPADECEELLLIAHMDGYYKGKQDGQNVRDSLVPVKVFRKLLYIQIGGCNCSTKTPNIEFHAEDCRYRLAVEIESMLKAARGES